jgi:hypothetical protein
MAGTVQWYSVTLTFASRIGGVASLRPLCEERVVLFRARSEARARLLAVKYAGEAEHSYLNSRNERVEWRFAGIEQLTLLDAPPTERGWEVGSRFVRRRWSTLRKNA